MKRDSYCSLAHKDKKKSSNQPPMIGTRFSSGGRANRRPLTNFPLQKSESVPRGFSNRFTWLFASCQFFLFSFPPLDLFVAQSWKDHVQDDKSNVFLKVSVATTTKKQQQLPCVRLKQMLTTQPKAKNISKISFKRVSGSPL